MIFKKNYRIWVNETELLFYKKYLITKIYELEWKFYTKQIYYFIVKF